MKNRLLVFTFILTTMTVMSQTGGESVFKFLNLPSSARQSALGGSVLTLENDIYQPLWNPATIDSTLNNKMAASYTNYLAGINLASFVYASKVNEKMGVFHLGITYLNYGQLTRADEFGTINGEFKAYDMAISVGYSYYIKVLKLNIGSNIKFINSLIDTHSSVGVAADFGMYYKATKSPFRMAFVLRNVGTQIKSFDGLNEKLPYEMTLGFSSQLEHVPIKWFVTIDNLQKWNISEPNPSNSNVEIESEESIPEEISFFNNASRHFVFGVELFPQNKLTFRFGYNNRRAKELSLPNTRTFGGLSYGFGLRLDKLHLNYSLTKFHPSANSNTFSLIIDLN
jgi:hypothetical protein